MKQASCWILLLFSLALYRTSNGETPETKWMEGGVYAFSSGSEYISMFVVTTEGVIAVEPIQIGHSELFLQAIKNVTNQPVKYLIYSHNHWDHTSGGKVFKEAGAKILAHAEATEWITVNTGPNQLVPDESFDGEKGEIKLGNTTIEWYYYGVNHGMGMVVLLLPAHKIAYISDIVVPNRVFFTVSPDFNIIEMTRTLIEVKKLDFTRAICTHNNKKNYMDGCNKTDVQAYIDFPNDIRAEVQKLMGDGVPTQDIPGRVNITKYMSWAFYNEWMEMSVWAVILADNLGSYPWRPARSFPPTTTTITTITTKAPSGNGHPTLKFSFEVIFTTLVVIAFLNKYL